MNETQLGTRVRDRGTGFEGRATARTVYEFDTPSVRVTGTDTGQEDVKERWVSESRLEAADESRATGFGRG